MKSISRAILVLLTVLPVILLGCKSETVEFADGETVVFQGTLETFTQIDTFEFVVTNSGTVSIEVTELDTRIGETGEPVESEGIGVAFGLLVPNGCQPTVSRVLQQGEGIAVFVGEDTFCVGTFVPAGIYPIGTVLEYTLTLASGA
jgi:hypothetical protein